MGDKKAKIVPKSILSTTIGTVSSTRAVFVHLMRATGRRKATALVIAVIVALVGFWFTGRSGNKPVVPTPVTQRPAQHVSLTPAQQAQVLGDTGDYAKAEQVWQQQLEQATDTTGKLNAYFQLSQVAIRFKRYDDANGYAAAAMKLAPSSYVPYAMYAKVAEAKGDTPAAKRYLQQTIAHINPNQDGANLIKNDYQTELDSLQ